MEHLSQCIVVILLPISDGLRLLKSPQLRIAILPFHFACLMDVLALA
jgi:hypothetical protein